MVEDNECLVGRKRSRRAAHLELGRAGERLAAAWLVQNGYSILERNFRGPYGEIDLIAEEGEELVFVEVKARRSVAYGLPEEAVTLHKCRKIALTAYYYLDMHACAGRSWRADVVAVQFNAGGRLEEVRIYRHAFSESEL